MGNAPEGGEIGLTLNDSTWYLLNQIMCNASGKPTDKQSYAHLNIYPNPSTGVFTIYPLHDNFDYYVTDFTGRIIKEGKITMPGDEINLSSFNTGVYLLILSNSQQVIGRKLIVVNP